MIVGSLSDPVYAWAPSIWKKPSAKERPIRPPAEMLPQDIWGKVATGAPSKVYWKLKTSVSKPFPGSTDVGVGFGLILKEKLQDSLGALSMVVGASDAHTPLSLTFNIVSAEALADPSAKAATIANAHTKPEVVTDLLTTLLPLVQ